MKQVTIKTIEDYSRLEIKDFYSDVMEAIYRCPNSARSKDLIAVNNPYQKLVNLYAFKPNYLDDKAYKDACNLQIKVMFNVVVQCDLLNRLGYGKYLCKETKRMMRDYKIEKLTK
jgi:hypothetical protein